MAVSKKGNRTQAKEVSTGLARRDANTTTLDKPSAESPEKVTKAGDGLVRGQQAFATTDVSLIAYLRLQAMAAAGGKPVEDDFASDYSLQQSILWEHATALRHSWRCRWWAFTAWQ